MLILSGLLAGCTTPPDRVPADAGAAAPNSAGQADRGATGVAVVPGPAVPTPGSPAARQQAQQMLRRVAELLNDGAEDKAREDLAIALSLEPDSKFGICLNKGLTADPLATLGRESTPYTVRPGETLGRIAQRALGDACEFYLLARYNQFAVPRQLHAGQVLRIPGRTPLAAPDAAAAPPTREEPARVQPEATSAPTDTTAAQARAAQDRLAETRLAETRLRARIDQHHRNAQSAFRRQDLATAIREWTRVLELDASNDLARARRQEALDLEARLKRLK